MSTKLTIEQIYRAHPATDCDAFRELVAMLESDRTPVLACAFRLFTMAAALRDAQKIERHRIMTIVDAGLDGDWRSALSLALTTELSAADAIEILRAKQSADIIRAN